MPTVYARLMGDVQRGVYLGIHEAAGVPCHHLSFEQATIDWQIWIDAGTDPLPRKLVITYKTEDEVPQYAVTIRKWNLQAKLPDTLFAVLVHPRAPRGLSSPRLTDRLEPSRENRNDAPTDRPFHGRGVDRGIDRRTVRATSHSLARLRVGGLQRAAAQRPPGRATPPRPRDSVPLERGRSSRRATATTSTDR